MMAGADGSLLADVETFNIDRLAAALRKSGVLQGRGVFPVGWLMQKSLAKRDRQPCSFATFSLIDLISAREPKR
jgi:hypothetical protein